MKNKRGISLIVLVITIIIMIILASAVIISLNNSGITNKANEAVTNSNLKQVEQLANVIWAEAYLDENIKTDEEYREYVESKLKENNIKLENYYIEVNTNGIIVEGPDVTKPTLTFACDKEGIKKGDTITFTVIFNDNKYISTIDLDTEDIILNGFTATKEITGEGNVRVITLLDVQGEEGEKTITIKAGVTKDTSKNESELTTSMSFELQVITLGSLIINADDYGKKVNYVSDNGITDWKVFYKQTIDNKDYIYLIASEKVEYDKIPENIPGTAKEKRSVTIGETTKELGNIYWSSWPGRGNVQNPELWMANFGSYTSTAPNIGATSFFLDEKYWTGFVNSEDYKDKNGTSYVVGAIGTPTAEMFVASWNAKRELAVARGDTSTYNIKIGLSSNGTGYALTSEPANGGANLKYLSTKDNLYIWSTKADTSIWLASPATVHDYLWCIFYNGQLYYGQCYSKELGIRPVVCLSADIPAEETETGYSI